MDILEWTAVIAGIIGVGLTIKQNPLCWPIGILNVCLYVYIFFHAKLYADMGLQVVYIVMQFYGWYMWLRGGPDRSPLTISRSTLKQLAIGTLLTIFFSTLLGYALTSRTDASYPYIDSTISGISLWAQYLQSLKKIECWFLWILVNLMACVLFYVKGLFPTTILYAIFLGLAVVGLREWLHAQTKIASRVS